METSPTKHLLVKLQPHIQGLKMRFLRLGKHAVPAWLIVVVMISTISVAVMAYVLSNSFTITLEVKEPLSIVDHPSEFSLFPGQTADFNVTVMNSAPVYYSVFLDFSVNDSEYQASYVSFSDQVYNVTPGQQNLEAWMSVASDAPVATVTMSVNLVRLGATVTKIPLNGLVGYWKFDEGSGNIAHDSSKNGNDGTIYGAAWTEGRVGKALQFNGVNCYVGIPSNPSITGFTQFTIEAWIKLESFRSEEMHIVSKNDGWTLPNPNAEYALYIEDEHNLKFAVSNGTIWFFEATATNAINDLGTWYNVAGTWDGINYAIYVNGVQVVAGKGPVGTIATGSAELQIGREGYWPWTYFNGTIDEVQIYNRALTPTEISTLYNI